MILSDDVIVKRETLDVPITLDLLDESLGFWVGFETASDRNLTFKYTKDGLTIIFWMYLMTDSKGVKTYVAHVYVTGYMTLISTTFGRLLNILNCAIEVKKYYFRNVKYDVKEITTIVKKFNL